MRRLLTAVALLLLAAGAYADEWAVRKKVAGGFEETREAITLAIENRGLVINYVSHLGDMLERTGADLGASRRIFGQAQIIEFCSARLSRQMLEIDPHNIVLCPFSIAVYTLPGETEGTWIAYRRPQGPAATIVEPLLQAIAGEAAP